MALRVPKLQPCVWVILVPGINHDGLACQCGSGSPDMLEVELLAFYSVSMLFSAYLLVEEFIELCTSEGTKLRLERVVWAMFAISPTNDSVLFVLNSGKLSLTYKITANKPTWDNVNFK